uniref:G-protein coupled receptors family 1 profile domain-containing protein n=1 Tax=Pristionchus pacificus TaxID=54126 RepID=A0A8R1YJL7_PRIPA
MTMDIVAALEGTLIRSQRESSETTLAPSSITSTTGSPAQIDNTLCLDIKDVFIALFLVLLILLTIFGNILVVLSVFMYKRMRTFTNILLTSLATADLLVGLIVMPISLLDLLHQHNWPFWKWLCSAWATIDVLLCTASILNLCVISLDRYFAITSPLKYPRTRSRKMAAGLLSAVWLLSFIVCSPPLFVQGWGHTPDDPPASQRESHITCSYSMSKPYRLYSASGSFYLPLLVMLLVYFKIFRVASEREALMRQSVGTGTCRLSNRIVKTQAKNNRRNPRCASAPMNRNRMAEGTRPNYSVRPLNNNKQHVNVRRLDSRIDSQDFSTFDRVSGSNGGMPSPKRQDTIDVVMSPDAPDGSSRSMERECHSLADLAEKSTINSTAKRKNTEIQTSINEEGETRSNGKGGRSSTTSRKSQLNSSSRLQPQNLMAKAHDHYQMCGPGKAARGSKEKMVYLRERKALKTIGIVVLGFIICWMPFFIYYMLEPFSIIPRHLEVIGDFFLWLGYSNSVLNPIIYTMYNGDFRRCFRDLLSFGCIQHHRRTMSVKKLHQQSTIF